jgi:hypothetical protein
MSHIPFTAKKYIIIVLEGDMLFAIARGTMTFFKKKRKRKMGWQHLYRPTHFDFYFILG